jgi:Flp pilus assembly protein TadB
MRRSRHDPPVLITTAPQSADDEYDRRRKRYAIMMAGRVVCVIIAALVYRDSLWLALGFAIGGAVLPWSAVIMANDRPPKKRQRGIAYGLSSGERALGAGPSDERIVDGQVDDRERGRSSE